MKITRSDAQYTFTVGNHQFFSLYHTLLLNVKKEVPVKLFQEYKGVSDRKMKELFFDWIDEKFPIFAAFSSFNVCYWEDMNDLFESYKALFSTPIPNVPAQPIKTSTVHITKHPEGGIIEEEIEEIE